MVRRILIEVDIEEDVNGMVKDIASMVMDRIDPNVEFTISQEIIPEKISRGIQIPDLKERRSVHNGETIDQDAVGTGKVSGAVTDG